jgi:hypothetical protein
MPTVLVPSGPSYRDKSGNMRQPMAQEHFCDDCGQPSGFIDNGRVGCGYDPTTDTITCIATAERKVG